MDLDRIYTYLVHVLERVLLTSLDRRVVLLQINQAAAFVYIPKRSRAKE